VSNGTTVPVTAEPQELEQVQRLAKSLDGSAAAELVSPDGERLAIPPSIFAALRQVADALAAGGEVSVSLGDPLMTSRQAALGLDVSRSHLLKLLDTGELAFERVGTHRRVRGSEIARYRDARRVPRKAALDALTALDAEDYS
jgi:excisionase family DNA binding protein